MTSIKRIYKIIAGIFMLVLSVILFLYPDKGYVFVLFILEITLLLYGFRLLIYYLTLARYMVGGIMTLYKSIMLIDFGLLIFNMKNYPQRLGMLYLIVILAFDGITDILKAMDARRLKAASWKYELTYGSIKVIIAVGGLFFMGSVRILTYIYCLGLIHSAVSSIVSAFRRTAIVHID